MSKFIIQVWDSTELEDVEGGADADSVKAKLTVVIEGEPTAERVVATLDNFIQMSDDSQIRDYWVISMNPLQELSSGNAIPEVAELFMKAEEAYKEAWQARD